MFTIQCKYFFIKILSITNLFPIFNALYLLCGIEKVAEVFRKSGVLRAGFRKTSASEAFDSSARATLTYDSPSIRHSPGPVSRSPGSELASS